MGCVFFLRCWRGDSNSHDTGHAGVAAVDPVVKKVQPSLESPLVMDQQPLLTIAIPTWQRASFLALNLARLARELAGTTDPVEVLVSDNASPDATPEVVQQAMQAGLPIRYIRNAMNIGSDANIAQCFNLAQGKYVLILSDDDLFVEGALSWLLQRLKQREFGVVCLRPYGYEVDARKEHPGGKEGKRAFDDGGAFLAAINVRVTLISACVINKNLLCGVDAMEFCGGNLVQVHLVIRAALLAKTNLCTDHYLIACKRNNSGGYHFSSIFVEELGRILDRYQSMGLTSKAIRAFETRLLLGYYPFYLLRQRSARQENLFATYEHFCARFGNRWLFHCWVAPILRLPRPLAILWGSGATVVGRIVSGDLRRGVIFTWNRIRQRVRFLFPLLATTTVPWWSAW